jgi:hypothetical protein
MADKSKMEQYPTRPKEMGKWEGFKAFLWNSETSECLGRTGSSWGKCQKFVEKNKTFFNRILMRVLYGIMLRNKKNFFRLEGKKHGRLCST